MSTRNRLEICSEHGNTVHDILVQLVRATRPRSLPRAPFRTTWGPRSIRPATAHLVTTFAPGMLSMKT